METKRYRQEISPLSSFVLWGCLFCPWEGHRGSLGSLSTGRGAESPGPWLQWWHSCRICDALLPLILASSVHQWHPRCSQGLLDMLISDSQPDLCRDQSMWNTSNVGSVQLQEFSHINTSYGGKESPLLQTLCVSLEVRLNLSNVPKWRMDIDDVARTWCGGYGTDFLGALKSPPISQWILGAGSRLLHYSCFAISALKDARKYTEASVAGDAYGFFIFPLESF